MSSSHPPPALLLAEAVELGEHPELLANGQDAVARLLAAGDHVHDPADLLGIGGHVEAEDLAVPVVGSRSVVMILMSVVLPAPLGPRRPKNRPGSTCRSTPARAVTSFGLAE